MTPWIRTGTAHRGTAELDGIRVRIDKFRGWLLGNVRKVANLSAPSREDELIARNKGNHDGPGLAALAVEVTKCPLCGSATRITFCEAGDYRFGVPGTFTVASCRECGFLYTCPRPSEASAGRLYEEYYPRQAASSPEGSRQGLRRQLRRWARRATGSYTEEILDRASGNILDFGCGTGGLVAELVGAGKNAVGFEIDEAVARRCRDQGLTVISGSWRQLAEHGATYDTVILSQVLEHLHSPIPVLRTLFAATQRGGKLYVYVPNFDSVWRRIFGKYWHGWHLPFHLYHFTEASLKSMLEVVGFEVVRVRSLTPVGGITVSLKSFIWGRGASESNSGMHLRLSGDQGSLFDSVAVRLMMGTACHALDFLWPRRGDCLAVEVRKP